MDGARARNEEPTFDKLAMWLDGIGHRAASVTGIILHEKVLEFVNKTYLPMTIEGGEEVMDDSASFVNVGTGRCS